MAKDVDSDGDDDKSVHFPARRKSHYKVIVDDLIVVRPPKKRNPGMDKLEAWFIELEKLSALYSDEKGELDISMAVSVEIDGPWLKESHLEDYCRLLNFAYNCRRKSHLKLFHHAADPGIDGLISVSGNALKEGDHDLAVMVIEEYQKTNKKMKLKLRHLMKLNVSTCCGLVYYLTFSALDEFTEEIKMYQAALLKYTNGYLLGLLRNVVDDVILVILSIKGAEEDMADLEDFAIERSAWGFKRE